MATIEVGASSWVRRTSTHHQRERHRARPTCASRCDPCRQFTAVHEQASLKYPDVVFDTVETEAEQPLATAAQITSIPTLVGFKDGSLVFAQPGAQQAPSRRPHWSRSAPRRFDSTSNGHARKPSS